MKRILLLIIITFFYGCSAITIVPIENKLEKYNNTTWNGCDNSNTASSLDTYNMNFYMENNKLMAKISKLTDKEHIGIYKTKFNSNLNLLELERFKTVLGYPDFSYLGVIDLEKNTYITKRYKFELKDSTFIKKYKNTIWYDDKLTKLELIEENNKLIGLFTLKNNDKFKGNIQYFKSENSLVITHKETIFSYSKNKLKTQILIIDSKKELLSGVSGYSNKKIVYEKLDLSSLAYFELLNNAKWEGSLGKEECQVESSIKDNYLHFLVNYKKSGSIAEFKGVYFKRNNNLILFLNKWINNSENIEEDLNIEGYFNPQNNIIIGNYNIGKYKEKKFKLKKIN